MSRIRVTIDQLALRGLGAAERATLVESLKSELARTMAEPAARAALTRSRRTPVIRLGRVTLTPGPAGGRSFGGGLARAIGRSLKS